MKKIKSIKKVEHLDYVIGVDTDSCYISAKTTMKIDGIDPDNFEEAKKYTIQKCSEYASKLNGFYDTLMLRFFNCEKHKIKMAEDVIARRVFWSVKKRYAMLKVFDMETKKDLDFKLEAKGLDIVRSSFPKAFKIFMEDFLIDILYAKGKSHTDNKILEFKSKITNLKPLDVAKNTSVRFFSQNGDNTNFNPIGREPLVFIKGTTGQLKSALAYNDLLKLFNLNKTHEPIYDGSKIKWVYLKRNPYGIEGLAMKADGTDPKVILDFIDAYIDHDKLFEKELETKLIHFYEDLKWEVFNENAEKAGEFFNF